MPEKQPARFGKYSKTIREQHETIQFLARFCEQEVGLRDAEIARLTELLKDLGVEANKPTTPQVPEGMSKEDISLPGVGQASPR